MALNTIYQQTNQPNINTTINDFHLKSLNIKMTKEYWSSLGTGAEMWRE
jgi:hypothetical protein